MIPSRGLRWSSQTIGIGRRRIEAFSFRQFSSTVQYGSIRASPLLSKNTAPIPRPYTRSQFSRLNVLIRNGAGVRFASSTPTSFPAPPVAPANPSAEAASSSAASTPADYVTSLDSATDFTSDAIYNIPEHIGYLKSLGLDYGYGPTALVEWTLEHVHIFCGTPWWISIALTALLFRAILFKPYIDAADNAARLATIMPITKPITAQMKVAQSNSDMDTMLKLRGELSMIHKRAGIKLWKSFVPMVQVFAGYGTFILLRAMAKLPVPGLETGGTLWFYNLAIPDPHFILPLATAGVLHWVLRKGGEMGTSTVSPGMMNAFKWGLPALTVIFTWWQPAALQLTFFISGLLSFGQASLFRTEWFRKFFNMTPIPKPAGDASAPPSPYKGRLKVAASPVLSQAELSQRFQGAQSNAPLQGTVSKIRGARPPGSAIGKVISTTFKDVSSVVKDVTGAGSGVVEKANKMMDRRKEKADLQERKAYEVKKQEQLKKERWEKERDRLAMRATRQLKR